MKVKNETKKRFKRKMKTLYTLLDNKKIDIKDLNQVKSSYLGHLSYGNKKKLVYNSLKHTIKEINLGKRYVINDT